jgi:hypothetical protein
MELAKVSSSSILVTYHLNKLNNYKMFKGEKKVEKIFQNS